MFYVDTTKVRDFIEEVSPCCSFRAEYDNGVVGFDFEDEDDREYAQRWIYANENQKVYYAGKYIGDIYYDVDYDYCFVCDADDKDFYYFASPDKAEDALIEYWESRN